MRPTHLFRAMAAIALLNLSSVSLARDDARSALWAAARNGDVKAAAAVLDKCADVNSQKEIGVTALWIAAGKDNLEVVELLLKHGADVNARDGIWYQTPLSTAVGSGYTKIVEALLKAGAKDTDEAFLSAVGRGNLAIMRAVLESKKVSAEVLSAALV